MKPARILALSDIHCGHRAGLTHPDYWFPERRKSPDYAFAVAQRAYWGWFISRLKQVGRCRACVFIGDAIDGRAEKSGGTELITGDRNIQVEMAAKVFGVIAKICGKPKVVGVYGTKYHVSGDGEDWEYVIAKDCGFEKLGGHEWATCEGVTFDLKHKIGSSAVPHGLHTAPAKDALWNELWAARALQPKADVILRGHSHTFGYCGTDRYLAVVLPGLQGFGSKFGVRECSKIVNYGFCHFDCREGRLTDWQAHIAELPGMRARSTTV